MWTLWGVCGGGQLLFIKLSHSSKGKYCVKKIRKIYHNFEYLFLWVSGKNMGLFRLKTLIEHILNVGQIKNKIMPFAET